MARLPVLLQEEKSEDERGRLCQDWSQAEIGGKTGRSGESRSLLAAHASAAGLPPARKISHRQCESRSLMASS